MKEYDYIHNASDERLAEMLENRAMLTRQSSINPNHRHSSDLSKAAELYDEAARRLRNIQRILDAKVPFNSEQFNV